jgi:hemolysin activation/secretion protein
MLRSLKFSVVLPAFLLLAAMAVTCSQVYADVPPPGATAGAEEARFRQQYRDEVRERRMLAEEEPEPEVETAEADLLGESFLIEKQQKPDALFESLVGVPLLNKLEREKKAAAERLDFERAIVFRDKLQELKKLPEYQQIAAVQDQMRQASGTENYEQAIEHRQELFRLQKELETPKPEPKFALRAVRIAGNESIPIHELTPFTEKIINHDVTLTEVQNVARDIKNYYRERGYVAAYAYVPEQNVDGGTVEIRVIEGRLGTIEITGNKWYSTELIKRHIKLEPGEIVQYDTLRRGILDIDRHRDLDAKAVLRPGTQPMTTDVQVQVQDRRPFHLTADFNNYGTRLTGEERWGFTAQHSNLFGMFDELTARFQAGDGSLSTGMDYNLPLFAENYLNGPRLGFAFSRGDVDLLGDFKALNFEGESTTYSPYLKYPVIANDNFRADLRLSYDHKFVENRALDVPTSQDDIRLASSAVVFEQNDKWGRTFWPNSLHFGLPYFGGTHKNDEALTRAHTGAPFTIYRTTFDRYQYLPYNSLLVLHGSLQLADDKLPPSEQFQLGGINSVRGYPQGEFLGDHGWTFSAELHVPAFFVDPRFKLPNEKRPLREDLRLLVFYDYGAADLKGPLPGELDEKDLASVGVGLRIRLYDRFNAKVEYGVPVSDKASDGRGGVWYYGISFDLL